MTSHGLRRVEHIMGMPIGIDVRDPAVDPSSLDRVFNWFRWVDAIFSPYRAESELSLLNRGELTLAEVHPEVREILELGEELRTKTDGYFDIRTDHLPISLRTVNGLLTSSGLDPSGLVKGWSVDRATQIIEEAGAGNYSINAGGDLRVRGGALPETHWRIGIRHPLLPDKVAAVVEVNDLAVATSGTYERGRHIVNPHTGEPPSGILSVTVVGRDLAMSDAYATAAFAIGIEGQTWTARLFGYEAMTILEDESVLSTRWFPAIGAA
ncbi:MAG: FAD:protein FMN transferase [Chloroflexota bacterium]|nr:FAD:protein FMN transferase [Chloroflexota bacterium]